MKVFIVVILMLLFGKEVDAQACQESCASNKSICTAQASSNYSFCQSDAWIEKNYCDSAAQQEYETCNAQPGCYPYGPCSYCGTQRTDALATCSAIYSDILVECQSYLNYENGWCNTSYDSCMSNC
jgi:hypothetical protein